MSESQRSEMEPGSDEEEAELHVSDNEEEEGTLQPADAVEAVGSPAESPGVGTPTRPATAESGLREGRGSSIEISSDKADGGTRTSSGASSQRSSFSTRAQHHVESGDTGVATSSPYPDSALQQFSSQLVGMDSEEECDEEEEHSLGHDEGQAEGGTSEDDDETQLVVLDPDHPLMTRFQSALKSYLLKQMEGLNLELREMSVQTKKSKTQREDLGVMLYGMQQELARLQMELEQHHDRHAQMATTRRQMEEELQHIRNLYKDTRSTTNEERKKVSALQTEVENLALRLFYMQNTNQDVYGDIVVMKRTVQKAEAERLQAEVEKQKQDLFMDRLTREADRLREQIALYEAQIEAQSYDTKAARETVAEACMEIETIIMEKRQLLQQWSSSLIGMSRRDEAFSAIQEALRQAEHQLKSYETEIEGYKKSAMKEEEKHEQLTVILNRAENDAALTRKIIAQSQAKQEALNVEYSTYTRTLHEIEQAFNRVTVERAARMGEMSAVRKQIEKESQIKLELEKQILAKIQEKITLSKAAKYSMQLINRAQGRRAKQEAEIAKIENETAQMALEVTQITARINMLKKTLDDLDKEMQDINQLITHSQNEISKRVLVIERKQAAINLFSKQIEAAVVHFGGKELGPLEIQINTLTKQIEDYSVEIAALRQYWLRLQNELVKLTREREEQEASVEMLKKEVTIHEQKKLRTENEIQQERTEQKDIEHHMKSLANDMVKLNTLLNKNISVKEQLQQDNLLMESDFMRALREAEKESIQMQEKLGSLQEEKERILTSLVEAEHQIMLWEKKIQLAKEMRYAVDSEAGQGEIRAMRGEVHRMQVRYGQLLKQQEKMIRDMEAVVARRETIVIRAKNQEKKDKKQVTASNFQIKLQELRKKIKEVQKNADECNGTINELQDSQRCLSDALQEKQLRNASLQSDSDALDTECERLQEKKRQNLFEIVAHQTRHKHLQAVKEGKYTLMCRTEQALACEQQKQEGRMHNVSTIVHQIQQEYPQFQGALRKLSLALESRLGAPQDTERTQ
ncbi:coiled-coil domain-containing protein 40 isoform X2 [Ambystoma mexicanum]|uniref:coiled-coil domain-containing protein 40 isoform X2 n=1 Tax=Ambystoma mexicanum TaxID=8296 RepID=UPI0037E7EB81